MCLVYFLYRCLELQVLTETYTSQSVHALKLLQSHLQQRQTKAEESLVKLRHSMDAYKDLDPKFQDLLKEYAKLQEDINFAKISTGLNNLWGLLMKVYIYLLQFSLVTVSILE